MANIEETPRKLILLSDAYAREGFRQRNAAAKDAAVLHRRTGEITVLTTEEAKDAAETG
jgi:hypothetical protein